MKRKTGHFEQHHDIKHFLPDPLPPKNPDFK